MGRAKKPKAPRLAPGQSKRPAIEGVIELGDIARDKITGMEGVVLCVSHWLENCDRIGIQPQGVKDDGSPHSMHQFDMPSCELIEKGAFKKKRPETGGPAPRGIEASR